MRPLPTIFLTMALAISAGAAWGLDVGALPLRPGETWPQPGQRGLDQVESVPTLSLACPACDYAVAAPDVDKLMRRRPGAAPDAPPPAWTLHAETRDADLCPHPGRGKVPFQADIVVCPACGFAGRRADYQTPLSPAMIAWVHEALRPSIRETQTALLGARAGEMRESHIVDFFNRQEDLPDTLRTEHYRVVRQALGAPALDQAEAAWLAGWAARRAYSGPFRGAFLARRDADVLEAVKKERTRRPDRDVEAALIHLLGKNRSGAERLPHYGDRLAARLRLAGLRARKGYYQPAVEALQSIAEAAAERFLRADQDPLWAHTPSRASRTARLAEVESIRRDVEAEVLARLELMAEEQAHLNKAVDLLRTALLGGELDDRPEEALFHAYLAGELLRRQGEFPLAAEWFKNLMLIAAADSPVRRAAEAQLEVLRGQASESVNLLAALGQDGDVFARLREIVGRAK